MTAVLAVGEVRRACGGCRGGGSDCDWAMAAVGIRWCREWRGGEKAVRRQGESGGGDGSGTSGKMAALVMVTGWVVMAVRRC